MIPSHGLVPMALLANWLPVDPESLGRPIILVKWI